MAMRGSDASAAAPSRRGLDLRRLVGSGDRIALFTLPVAIVGSIVQLTNPAMLAVDGASQPLRAVSIFALTVGGLTWAWSVGLILSMVPRGELITTGPYVIVKHPLYTSVGLLALPSLGILLGTWLGAVIGLAVYAGARLFAPAEEAELHRTYGSRWEAYVRSVKLPWL
jgi:protein-S-isoprenylcysteine O-methyltransferase Ste14